MSLEELSKKVFIQAILEETDMAITEIRKDAFDFQREILIGWEIFNLNS